MNINGYSILTLNIKDGLDYKLTAQVSFKLPAVFFTAVPSPVLRYSITNSYYKIL